MLDVLTRFFGAATGRDGEAAALLPRATGLALPADEDPVDRSTGRRERVVGSAEEQIAAALAEKVLRAWLANRHQTLLPLAADLSRLDAGGRAALADLLAIAVGSEPDGQGTAREGAERWLVTARGDPACLERFRQSCATPPALGPTLASLDAAGLAPLAFVAALVGIRRRGPAAALFGEYVAARLGLPASVQRAATRRYGA